MGGRGAVQLPAMFKFILATLANVHPFFMGGTSGVFPSLRLLFLKCRIMFPVCASSIFQFGGGTQQHAGHVGDTAHDCSDISPELLRRAARNRSKSRAKPSNTRGTKKYEK